MSGFDEVIHQPTRLRLCAALTTATEVEFAALEEALSVSASLLSKQLKVLSDAGYVVLDRRRQPVGRPRVWVRLTSAGRRAYAGHVEALREIVTASEPVAPSTPDRPAPAERPGSARRGRGQCKEGL